jgi:hypothetical protein
MNIHADIVFGDPWGMSNIDWKQGESLVITRTDSGEALITDLIKEKRVLLNETSFEEVRIGQHIESRKLQVTYCFEVYKKYGWCLPDYAPTLHVNGDGDAICSIV